MKDKLEKIDEEWRQRLSSEQYRVTRCKGTEPAFTGQYWDHKEDGVYRCVGCGEPLFDSEAKYDSGTGWPSFHAPHTEDSVRSDRDHGMVRTEVLCKRCDAHLGHVFPDGPGSGGTRYCINSAALDFEKSD